MKEKPLLEIEITKLEDGKLRARAECDGRYRFFEGSDLASTLESVASSFNEQRPDLR